MLFSIGSNQKKISDGQVGLQFKRAFRRKNIAKDQEENLVDNPKELERASYATSINNLPERPAAFNKVCYI